MRKMKILLVNPPNCGRSIPEEEYGITSLKQIFKGEPFNLEVLAGPLIEHEVLIFDGKCESEEAFGKTFNDFQPDVVGFTAVSCETRTVIKYAAGIREKSKATLIVGGNAATHHPESFNRPEIDYVVMGLGKSSFTGLIAALSEGREGEGIPGVARVVPGKPLLFSPRKFGRADVMENIAPRYDLVEKNRGQYYLGQLGLSMGFVITAYGCTHRCSFCTIPGITGGKYLTHGADTVIRDIGLLGDIPFIRMVDANTFGNTAQAFDLCEKILRSGIRKKFFADVRADTIVRHPGLLKKWKEAGLYAVVVGFEDMVGERLNAYDKKYGERVIPEAIRILHELGIVIVGDFIVSPAYSEDDFEKLESFIVSQKIEIPVLSILTPIPGTPIYKTMKNEIVISDLDYYTFTNAVTKTKMPAEPFYRTYSNLVCRLHEKPHSPK